MGMKFIKKIEFIYNFINISFFLEVRFGSKI